MFLRLSIVFLLVVFGSCIAIPKYTSKLLIGDLEARLKVLNELDGSYLEYIRAPDPSEERMEKKAEFISMYNSTFRLTYSWILRVLTTDEAAGSLLTAALRKTADNLEQTQALMDRALTGLEDAAKITVRYMRTTDEPDAIVEEFILTSRETMANTKQIVQKAVQTVAKVIWKKSFLSQLSTFVTPRRHFFDIVALVVKFLRQKYPFRAWMVMRFDGYKQKPRVACSLSEPSAYFLLARGQELFVTHTDPTPNASRSAHAKSLIARPKGSKIAGINCDRYGERIYSEMGYTCGASRPIHAFVGAFPRMRRNVENEMATTHPTLLFHRKVRRHMAMIFCQMHYDVVVFG